MKSVNCAVKMLKDHEVHIFKDYEFHELHEFFIIILNLRVRMEDNRVNENSCNS